MPPPLEIILLVCFNGKIVRCRTVNDWEEVTHEDARTRLTVSSLVQDPKNDGPLLPQHLRDVVSTYQIYLGKMIQSII